eukprot:Rmarinus@m.29555
MDQTYFAPHQLCFPYCWNRHQLLLLTVMMASKYLCDSPYENVCWVSISDSTWTLAQINEMELTFLKHLHWNAHIAPDTLHEYAMQATAAVSILHLPLPLRKQAGMV